MMEGLKVTVEMLEIKIDYGAEKGMKPPGNRWIAVIMSPAGSHIIAQSPWRKSPTDKELGLSRFSSQIARNNVHSKANQRYQQEFDSDRMTLLGQLLADGWEPIGTNDRGQVVTMKR